MHTLSAGLVHVPCLAADESLINLDLAVRPTAELAASALVLQSKTDAMQHEPCRLLSYSDSSGDLVRTNPIAAIGDHPDHHQPLLQGNRRVLKYGSNLCGELAFWVSAFALPFALIVQEPNVIPTAGGAGDNAMRPAKFGDVGQSVIRIAEINYCILQSLWLASVAVHAANIGCKL